MLAVTVEMGVQTWFACSQFSLFSFCPPRLLTQETLALPSRRDKEVEGPSLLLQISCNCRVIKWLKKNERKKWCRRGRKNGHKGVKWAHREMIDVSRGTAFADSYQRGQPFAHYSHLLAAWDQWLHSNNNRQPWPFLINSNCKLTCWTITSVLWDTTELVLL